jgi:hypothetical protein
VPVSVAHRHVVLFQHVRHMRSTVLQLRTVGPQDPPTQFVFVRRPRRQREEVAERLIVTESCSALGEPATPLLVTRLDLELSRDPGHVSMF